MVDNPMKKTLLALGFLKGDVVDNWVDVQHNWINGQRAPTVTAPRGRVADKRSSWFLMTWATVGKSRRF